MSRMVGMWFSFWEGTGEDRGRRVGVVLEVHDAGLLVDDWTGVDQIDSVEDAVRSVEAGVVDEWSDVCFIRWTDMGDNIGFGSPRKGLEALQRRLAREARELEAEVQTS